MSERTFKTAWFSQTAKKARISDKALCKAIEQVARGQADDLGGGVFKKRLNDNMHRSIILAKAGEYWVFAYLFAKKDRANIDDDELMAFRKLAELYRRKTQAELDAEICAGALMEICNGD
ncbi:type II toxin-antitoxin system RelE/ParE family toxin [Ensifer canadensis]